MKLIREKCCCFTGHRVVSAQDRAALSPRLRREIARLYGQGVDIFLAGGALGFDTLASQEVLALRAALPGLALVLVLPCLDQDRLWRPKDIGRYRRLIDQADEVIYTGDLYSREAMLVRNRYLVDRSAHCLCYLRDTARGGTAYTVRYARKQGLAVTNLAATAQTSLFPEPGERAD